MMMGEVFSFLLMVGFVVIVIMMVLSSIALVYFVMRDIFKQGE
jgi:uncharacterized membrane protein